jgi:hypothetical protein
LKDTNTQTETETSSNLFFFFCDFRQTFNACGCCARRHRGKNLQNGATTTTRPPPHRPLLLYERKKERKKKKEKEKKKKFIEIFFFFFSKRLHHVPNHHQQQRRPQQRPSRDTNTHSRLISRTTNRPTRRRDIPTLTTAAPARTPIQPGAGYRAPQQAQQPSPARRPQVATNPSPAPSRDHSSLGRAPGANGAAPPGRQPPGPTPVAGRLTLGARGSAIVQRPSRPQQLEELAKHVGSLTAKQDNTRFKLEKLLLRVQEG